MVEFVPWTEDEVATLVRLRAEKVSTKEIARILNRPYRGVKDKAWRMGLEGRRKWTPAEDAFLIENLPSMTQAEIGKALAIDRRHIRARVASLKLHNPQRREAAKRAAEERASGDFVAKALDDDAHVAAVLAQGGFKVLDTARFRRAA